MYKAYITISSQRNKSISGLDIGYGCDVMWSAGYVSIFEEVRGLVGVSTKFSTIFSNPLHKPIGENKLYIGLFLVLKRKRYNISFKDTKTKIDWYKALFLPVFVLILIFSNTNPLNPLHKPTNNQQTNRRWS